MVRKLIKPTEQELMDKARIIYPMLTYYKDANLGGSKQIQGELKFYNMAHGAMITDGWGGSVYSRGHWAEILSKYGEQIKKTFKMKLNFLN